MKSLLLCGGEIGEVQIALLPLFRAVILHFQEGESEVPNIRGNLINQDALPGLINGQVVLGGELSVTVYL